MLLNFCIGEEYKNTPPNKYTIEQINPNFTQGTKDQAQLSHFGHIT